MKQPTGINNEEWTIACARAARAANYAKAFPNHIRPRDERFQDPRWQWEHEVRGRPTGNTLRSKEE